MNPHADTIPMTPGMAECLDAIRRLTKNDVPPSYDELCAELRVSRNPLHAMLTRMKERGLVTWEPAQARTLRIVCKPDDYDNLPTDTLLRMKRRIDAVLCNRAA